MRTNRGPPALVWGTWRVEQINLDGRLRLCVEDGRYLVGHCDTAQEALDLLAATACRSTN